MTNAVGKFYTYTEAEHAQDPDITSQYKKWWVMGQK